MFLPTVSVEKLWRQTCTFLVGRPALCEQLGTTYQNYKWFFPLGAVIPLLGMCAGGQPSYQGNNTCTHLFLEVVVIRAKGFKQAECDREGLLKTDCSPATQWDTTQIQRRGKHSALIWNNLKGIFLSETEKGKRNLRCRRVQVTCYQFCEKVRRDTKYIQVTHSFMKKR